MPAFPHRVPGKALRPACVARGASPELFCGAQWFYASYKPSFYATIAGNGSANGCRTAYKKLNSIVSCGMAFLCLLGAVVNASTTSDAHCTLIEAGRHQVLANRRHAGSRLPSRSRHSIAKGINPARHARRSLVSALSIVSRGYPTST